MLRIFLQPENAHLPCVPMKLVLLKPETLQWLGDRHAVSPEDSIINQIDGTPDEGECIPPLPSLTGIDEDLVWIWRCREMGLGWKDIAPMIGLKTPAGAWKRFHRLLRGARKKGAPSLGGFDAQDAC